MKHFYYYPKINYSNNEAVNILVRGKIRDEILKETSLFYAYTMEDGESFEAISKKYYGSSSYVWSIFYANNIIDPERDLHKSHNDFIKFIKVKYGSIETPSQTIHHYEYTNALRNKTYIIDQQTYENYLEEDDAETETRKSVKSVSVYDYEVALNEEKRNIFVLEKNNLTRITNELKNLFK